MQALDRCLGEATTDENALTTALALLPTTVASLDAQQYNEVLTKVAAIDDDGTVAALTTPCIHQATPDQLSKAPDALATCVQKCLAVDDAAALLAFVEKRRDCGSQCAALLEKAAQTLADRCSTKASPESLELLGALLEAYADVRCKAEPLQKALVDAEARANAQRCLAVLWSRGPADSFAAAAAGVLAALEAAEEDALGPVAAAEALIMAARTRRDGAPLPLTRLVRAAMKHTTLIASLIDALPASVTRRHGLSLMKAALGECQRTRWRDAPTIRALATVSSALGAGGAELVDDAVPHLIRAALAASISIEPKDEAPPPETKKRKRRRPPRRAPARPHWDISDAARAALDALATIVHACGPRLRDRALVERAGAALLDHAPLDLRRATLNLAAALVAAPLDGQRSPLIVAARAASVAAHDSAETRAAAYRLQAACDAMLRPRCAPLAPPRIAAPPARGDLLAALFPGDDASGSDDDGAEAAPPAPPVAAQPTAPAAAASPPMPPAATPPPAAAPPAADDDDEFPEIIT
jgi:hypothetical protein